MNIEKIVEIINIDVTDITNLDKIFLANLKYIESAEEKEFKITQPRYSTLLEKLTQSVKYHYSEYYSQLFEVDKYEEKEKILIISEELTQTILKSYSSSTLLRVYPPLSILSGVKTENRYIRQCRRLSIELGDNILSALTKINSTKKNTFSFYEVYNPENTHQAEVEILIKRAIDIIQNDNNLTLHAQKRIIRHLEKALNALNRGDNSTFFGCIKEVDITLTVIGSMGDGIAAVTQMVQETIGEAVTIVEKSSTINQYLPLNYKPSFLTQQATLEGEYNNSKPLLPGDFGDSVDANLSENQHSSE